MTDVSEKSILVETIDALAWHLDIKELQHLKKALSDFIEIKQRAQDESNRQSAT